ncbi:MAG: hypothetical protein QW052_06880 [Candidatus Nitrosocaldaceae archaeon]
MLIDPHGSLARDIYSILREEGRDAIYLDMNTNHKINPIGESNIHLLSFISVLKNLYDYAWGDRLETILRNILLLIAESDPPCMLTKIARVLSNKQYRDMLVKGSGNPDMSNFWFHIYPNYTYDAFTSVYNKIDKLLSISNIRKIFDVESSDINIDEIVRGKIMIIDLSSIIADDIIRFVGSIFIHMLYVSAKSKSALSNKYYLYIDEAQLINTFAIREVLNAMRKFNVNVTLATQSMNRFDDSIRREITSLCRTFIRVIYLMYGISSIIFLSTSYKRIKELSYIV